MIGYDFDKTIYKRDCSTDFFFYINLTRPYLLIFTPFYLVVFALYGMKIISKKKFKELMFFYIPWHKSKIHKIVDKFWEKNANDILDWYNNQRNEKDVIISAGLRFIIEPVANLLNVKNLIATNYDINTGKIIGDNCYGQAKVVEFNKFFPNQTLEAFYSDSRSDVPMMQISKKGYLVKGNQLTDITGTY